MSRKPFLNSPWAPRLFAFLLGVLALALVEIGLGWVTAPSRLDNILSLLRRDSALFWTQKPSLEQGFFGTIVVTDSLGLRNTQGGRADVLVLGASPTFGWGVRQEETYSAFLQKSLGDRVRVVNGGVIGYSSHQGLGFLKRHWDELQPKVVTVAYVINDVDSYRFFRSDGRPDKELAPLGLFSTWVLNSLEKSALFGAMNQIFRTRRGGVDHSILPGEKRVSRQDYEANLMEFAVWVRGRGAEVLFIKMPVNLPAGDSGAGDVDTGAGDCPGAQDLNRSRALYFKGVCARKAGLFEQAEAFFDSVKRSESQRCARDAILYNESMLAVASDLKVEVVDIISEFRKHKYEYLFVDKRRDTIHPNAAGHRIIAQALFAKVDALLKSRQSGLPRGNSPPASP